MSSFFRNLFGSKKNSKVSKKAISRRLELLGLEERVVPTVTANFATGVLSITAGTTSTNPDSFDVVANADGTLTITSTAGVTAGSAAVTVTAQGGNAFLVSVVSGATNVTSLSLLGDNTTGADQIFNVGTINSTAFGANFGLNVDMNGSGSGFGSTDKLNFNGAITLKGTGALTVANVDAFTIAAAGDIVAATGAVGITSAGTLSTAGDVTTTTGAITISAVTGPITISGNVAITSTSGNLSMGAVTGSSSNLTISEGTGTVTVGALNLGSGNLTVTSTATPSSGSAISLAAVTAGAVSLTGAGDVSVSGVVSAASVNAKSTAGDVVFGNTVTTSAVGGFTSEATLATKATKIADLVTVNNGANALVTGNLVTTSDFNSLTPGIEVEGTGTINITGKVDASANGNDLALIALNGAITIGGAVGSSTTAMGDLNASGNTSFTASGAVTVEVLDFNRSSKFGTSISFAEAVKVTGVDGAIIGSSGTGTISFAKTIEATSAAGVIELSSVNGSLTVTGNITGKGSVEISSTSGAISVAGITTDQAGADITIVSDTGSITTSGAISTSGATTSSDDAGIEIDTVTSGNITIGGNVSTSGGGDILLGADTGTTASGTGNLTINGTVSTTGTTESGDVVIGTGGTGTVTVNNALSTGTASSNPGSVVLIAVGSQANSLNVSRDVTINSADGVAFITTGPTNTISLAIGANVTSVNDVVDSGFGTGILNLASNITATGATGDIIINQVAINLTGAVSINASGAAANIVLGNVSSSGGSLNGAQNLTLEATSQISLGDVGQTTPLATVTVTNSAGVTTNNGFSAANVVLSDTTGAISFLGDTVISNSLTTTAKAYALGFNGSTAVLSGAPNFLNTGGVELSSLSTSLVSGATITGNSTSTVLLSGTIVSGGAFNIGAPGNTGLVRIVDQTQLILNSSSAISTIANPIDIVGQGSPNTLSLLGVGTLTLSGDSSASTQSGDNINVTNGTLNVTGKVASAIALTNGTLSGAGGTTGAVTTTVGNVTPGGTLKTGDVSLNGATNYNIAVVSSTVANNVDVTGAVNLGSAILNLTSVASGLQAGNQLIIVNNDGSDAINGTFASLAEGATVSAKDASGNTVFFRISYKGTDGTTGNDAVLTVLGLQTMPLQPMVAGQPALNKFMVVGADAGGGPLVTITFPNGTYTSFFAYDSAFKGGVRVAAADVNGDGNLDIVTGAGAGGGPNVKVFQVNELSGAVSLQTSFFAFSAPSFSGGVYVAAGDTNNDGFDDVIVGAGATGGSRVQVYAGSANGLVTGSTLNDFFAYSPAFTGGVVVAAGFRDGIAGQDVVTAPASNGGYNIRSFNCNGTGNTPTLVDNFFAFNNTTAVGGLSLALQDLDGTPVDDIIIGSTNSQFGVVLNQTGSSNPNTITANPFPGFTGAIRAGVAQDANFKYAVAAAGPGGGPVTTVYQVINGGLSQTDSLFVLNPQFTGGLFVSS
jgi:hypothetical protein